MRDFAAPSLMTMENTVGGDANCVDGYNQYAGRTTLEPCLCNAGYELQGKICVACPVGKARHCSAKAFSGRTRWRKRNNSKLLGSCHSINLSKASELRQPSAKAARGRAPSGARWAGREPKWCAEVRIIPASPSSVATFSVGSRLGLTTAACGFVIVSWCRRRGGEPTRDSARQRVKCHVQEGGREE
jgi:hypothetical protein